MQVIRGGQGFTRICRAARPSAPWPGNFVTNNTIGTAVDGRSDQGTPRLATNGDEAHFSRMITQPDPKPEILARSAAIVAGLRALLPAEAVIADPLRLKAYETVGVPA